MKNIIFNILCLLFLISCGSQNNHKNNTSGNNTLLTKKVTIQDRIAFKNEKHPEWILGFDHEGFVNKVSSKVLSGEFAECYTSEYEKAANLLDLEDVKKRMGIKFDSTIVKNKMLEITDTIVNESKVDLSELIEIILWEEWELNEIDLKFIKKIKQWALVREYYSSEDIEKNEPRYRMPFVIKNANNTDKNIKIAEDIVTEFSFWHEHLDRIGLDKTKFLKFIFDNIQSGKIVSYDPIYLIDKSKHSFTFEQLQQNSRMTVNPYEFIDDVNQLIFVEDWFFDFDTFALEKKVKGIGFVADQQFNGEWQDKILFFIFFE